LRETSLVAAAKVIPVKYEEELEDFVVEVDILTQIRHPGIVGLHGSWLCDSKLWLVIELCEGAFFRGSGSSTPLPIRSSICGAADVVARRCDAIILSRCLFCSVAAVCRL
jgi:hypothetical protein